METYSSLGDLLLRRYMSDFISRTQQLSAPTYSRLRENPNYSPSGDGCFFAVEVDGNESGMAWRHRDDSSLPVAGNERVVRARVLPKKFYSVVTFSGLAEAVSARGGEDAFASGITYAVSQAVRRTGAVFETTFTRGDGYGKIATTGTAPTAAVTFAVDDVRAIRPGQVIVVLNGAGVLQDGPVQVVSRSMSAGTITVNAPVTWTGTGHGVYIANEQNQISGLAEITSLGLPALVNNTGTIYEKIDRSNYPQFQSQVYDAGGGSLDESMLRRLRRRLMIDTAMENLQGFAMLSNHEQFDRYVEIGLPFRRFNDMRIELGAQQELVSFEGRPWYLSWSIHPNVLYFLNMDAIERGVVRPLSIDERVNMAWLPGQDAFTILMKYYGENIIRYPNQTAKITSLSVPTW